MVWRRDNTSSVQKGGTLKEMVPKTGERGKWVGPCVKPMIGKRGEEFGQPDGLVIRLASLLECVFQPKLPNFNLESEIVTLLEMLLVQDHLMKLRSNS
uniref:Uncharacterized protein n=1 Tax=Oryza punctata TaxID=4537 RepID=A0A0E0KEC7_ORYPU